MQPDQPSQSFWRVPRHARRSALQMARRQHWPDLPFIHAEIQQRMLERAEIMRPAPGCVLDMSLGRTDAAQRLAEQFSDRDVRCVQWLSPPESRIEGGFLTGLLQRLRSPRDTRASVRPLVLQDETTALEGIPPAGLVWSNGLLHRVQDPAALLQRWRNSLVPGGALFFSCFGPDTAGELALAARECGMVFPDFADMHDWGDILVRGGFSDPVMEMERLVLTYRSVDQLLLDWHALGGNAAMQSGTGLRGRQFLKTVHKVLQSGSSGSLQLTLEILYGHAWRVDRPARSQEVSIPVSSIRRKPPSP